MEDVGVAIGIGFSCILAQATLDSEKTSVTKFFAAVQATECTHLTASKVALSTGERVSSALTSRPSGDG